MNEQQSNPVFLITANDSFTAEAYINLLAENGIKAEIKKRKPYLPKFVSLGYEKYIDIHVSGDKLDEANELLAIYDTTPYSDGEATDGGDATNSGDPLDDERTITVVAEQHQGGLRGKIPKIGFVFLMLILLLPVIVAIIAIINHIQLRL